MSQINHNDDKLQTQHKVRSENLQRNLRLMEYGLHELLSCFFRQLPKRGVSCFTFYDNFKQCILVLSKVSLYIEMFSWNYEFSADIWLDSHFNAQFDIMAVLMISKNNHSLMNFEKYKLYRYLSLSSYYVGRHGKHLLYFDYRLGFSLWHRFLNHYNTSKFLNPP